MEDVIEDALRKRAFDNITGIVLLLRDLKDSGNDRLWENCEEIVFPES